MNTNNKIVNFWNKLPLNKKFSSVIIVVLTIPAILLLSMSFYDMRTVELEQISITALRDLEKIDVLAQNNGNMASTIVQVVKTNPELSNMLNTELTTAELIEFNTNILPYFENIVITNPYIKNLRIYTSTNSIAERYPIIIDKERVKNEEWFIKASAKNLQRRVGYSESLSEHIIQFSDSSLISYYQALEIYQDEKTVVEVSFSMDDFFGEVYSSGENGICVIKANDEYFVHNSDDTNYQLLIDTLVQIGDEDFTSKVMTISSHEYLINHKHSKSLGFSYYIINDLTVKFSQLGATQVRLFFLILLLFVVLAFIFQIISNVLLSRIYATIVAMRELETVSTDNLIQVQIENPSNDEIGELQKHFNNMVVQIDGLIKEESKRAILEKDAEIKALQNQINSHFLYNVLNNIEMMAIIDNNYLIADTVTALARLLRYSMNWSKQLVPLTNELDYVRDYISLFNMRFDNSISLICDIPDKLELALIPKMSVQPIVENAIVHGIENLESDEIIRISARLHKHDLTISITDTGMGMNKHDLEQLKDKLKNGRHPDSLTGIGLNNVFERIEKRFGDGYGIDIYSKENEYTKVVIKIPFIE